MFTSSFDRTLTSRYRSIIASLASVNSYFTDNDIT